MLRGQVDICARVIRWAERAGWASNVRWPDERRLAARLAPEARHRRFSGMTVRQPAP